MHLWTLALGASREGRQELASGTALAADAVAALSDATAQALLLFPADDGWREHVVEVERVPPYLLLQAALALPKRRSVGRDLAFHRN